MSRALNRLSFMENLLLLKASIKSPQDWFDEGADFLMARWRADA
jgi:hypothetical protein